MDTELKIQSLRNEFISNINKIQESYSTQLYGYPPGWDAVKKEKIPGTRANTQLIENFCKIKGL